MDIMNIISIYPPNNINKLNAELSMRYVNDELFRSNFFKICIRCVEPIDVLYRRMYEERYLRLPRKDLSKFNNEMQYYMLNITVGEAIYFVNKVIPPILKRKYGDSQTESIEMILDLMKHFLMESTGQEGYYQSELKKAIGFNYFETSNSYDLHRNRMLRKFNPNGSIIDVMVCDCISDLYHENPDILDTKHDIHVMFNFLKKNNLQQIIDIINNCEKSDVNKIYILNIFKTEFEGYFVDMYIENYKFNLAPDIQKIFKASYRKFIK